MTVLFVDTNVFVRHFTRDQPYHSPRATAFLRRVAAGTIEATTSAHVLVELEVVLRQRYHKARAEIADALEAVLDLPGLRMPGAGPLRQAIGLYRGERVDLVDALIGLEMAQRGLNTIVSFDHHLDRVPGIVRQEP